MLRSLNTAISGLQQFQMQIDVVGNNIANVSTTGFKTARTEFQDSFSQALAGPNTQVGSGVSTAANSNNYNQGAITSTEVDTDLAISGQGFFMVRDTVDSKQYATRAGNFHLDSTGYLVTTDGLRVQGSTGDLLVDPTTTASLSIDQNGFINVTKKDGTTAVAGQVQLQNFTNPSALVKEGENRYSGTAAAGPLAAISAPQTNGLGAIKSGALELSNVDLTSEMSNLIMAQRAFQANARIITTSDEVLQEVVNLKR
jgi:flagellar hook protein FlgE